MKKLFNSLFLIGAVATVFTACKKDEITNTGTDLQETSAATGKAKPNNDLLPGETTYTLTKRDKDSLTYYSDGRLAKVLHGTGSYTQYNYGFNTVIAKEYSLPDNKVQKEIAYQIDPQTGRTYEAKSTVYSYNNNGAIVITKTLKYEYDGDGHVKKQYNKDKPLERTIFSWGVDGEDITAAYFFNEAGSQYSIVQFPTLANADKLKLQPRRTQLDPYLKIFGKGFKHMIGREMVQSDPNLPPTIDETFTYSFNTDGYPVSCSVTNKINNQPLGNFLYRYLAIRK